MHDTDGNTQNKLAHTIAPVTVKHMTQHQTCRETSCYTTDGVKVPFERMWVRVGETWRKVDVSSTKSGEYVTLEALQSMDVVDITVDGMAMRLDPSGMWGRAGRRFSHEKLLARMTKQYPDLEERQTRLKQVTALMLEHAGDFQSGDTYLEAIADMWLRYSGDVTELTQNPLLFTTEAGRVWNENPANRKKLENLVSTLSGRLDNLALRETAAVTLVLMPTKVPLPRDVQVKLADSSLMATLLSPKTIKIEKGTEYHNQIIGKLEERGKVKFAATHLSRGYLAPEYHSHSRNTLLRSGANGETLEQIKHLGEYDEKWKDIADTLQRALERAERIETLEAVKAMQEGLAPGGNTLQSVGALRNVTVAELRAAIGGVTTDNSTMQTTRLETYLEARGQGFSHRELMEAQAAGVSYMAYRVLRRTDRGEESFSHTQILQAASDGSVTVPAVKSHAHGWEMERAQYRTLDDAGRLYLERELSGEGTIKAGDVVGLVNELHVQRVPVSVTQIQEALKKGLAGGGQSDADATYSYLVARQTGISHENLVRGAMYGYSPYIFVQAREAGVTSEELFECNNGQQKAAWEPHELDNYIEQRELGFSHRELVDGRGFVPWSGAREGTDLDRGVYMKNHGEPRRPKPGSSFGEPYSDGELLRLRRRKKPETKKLLVEKNVGGGIGGYALSTGGAFPY